MGSFAYSAVKLLRLVWRTFQIPPLELMRALPLADSAALMLAL